MGLFGIGKKKHRNDFAIKTQEIGEDIVRLYTEAVQIPFEKTSEMERQVLALYLFGMANGMSEKSKESLEDIEASVAAVLFMLFRYSIEDAGEFVKNMSSSMQSGDGDNKARAIIQRARKAYFAYKDGAKGKVIDDICKVVASMR